MRKHFPQVEKECLSCHRIFKSYRGRNRKYCCIACRDAWIDAHPKTEERFAITCQHCGTVVLVPLCRKLKAKFCSPRCKGTFNGRKNSKMRSDREEGRRPCKGYRRKFRRPLHRVKMEEHLGRPLQRSECVHHINGNILDNRIENLAVMSHSEHCRIHRLWQFAIDARISKVNTQP